ncbi:MAG TPA: D-arabinono-1,4-lactone oxidase [Acidimicrobiales bacterium]|nr:D-arabinono-1,4-lactone oxidase [Acidimicrobiales bacterium]
MHRPGSVDELRRIVAGSRRVRALGRGHSFSPVVDCDSDSDGDLVLTDGLPPFVEVDAGGATRPTATVGGGMSMGAVAAELQRAGWALANMASLPHISVAGACATATHGSGDALRVLAAGVAAVQLVGPEGDLVELSRAGDPDTFAGAVVALGALGVVTRLTLDVEPTFDVAQRVHLEVPLDDVAGRFDEVFGAAYSVSVFTDWGSGEGMVWLKQRTDRPAAAPGETETTEAWTGGRPAEHRVHPVPGMPVEACTEQLGIPGPWHERLPHFRSDLTPSAGHELQSELFLPRAAAPAAFAALQALGDRLAPLLHVAEVRTVKADDLWLSPAHGRATVTFHCTWVDDAAAVLPMIGAVEERLMPLGARPHWAKLTTLEPSDIAAHYDRAPAFARLVTEHDPTGRFRNRFVDQLLGFRDPRGC